MSDNTDVKSIRVNVRIPVKQYQLLQRFGDALGLPETDGARVKHFLTLGIQASAGGVGTLLAVENNAAAVEEMRRVNAWGEQMDLTKEAEKLPS